MDKFYIVLVIVLCASCNGLNEKKSYYDNGELRSEWFINDEGLIEGEKKDYYNDGKIMSIGSWINDTLEGELITFYKNSNIKNKGFYHKGKQNGRFIFYYEDGKIKQDSYWSNGFKNGEGTTYFEDSSFAKYEKEYFVNFHGKETSLGWYAIDRNGNIYNESRRVHFKSKTDTVNLGDQIELVLELRKPRFTYTQFITGNYDDKFFLMDSSSLDTLNAVNQRIVLKLIPKQKGEKSIRGFARNYNPLPNGYYEQVNPVYFEKKYFVK